MLDNNTILYDRSRAVQDWKCPRSRMYAYELNGTGIASNDTHLELYLGQIVHDGLAAIANGLGIDSIADVGSKQMFDTLMADMAGESSAEGFAKEQAALVEGLLRGFYKHVWPRLRAKFPEVVAIEQEMLYEHGRNCIFMSRPDLVVRDASGEVWYVEYKTTGSNKETWINSWSTAVQLHSAVRAIEATLKEKVTGVVVQGLYKGAISYGKQSSPFCYAYLKAGNPPFIKEDIQYEYKAGYRRSPTWEREGGVKAWVEGMPEHVLAAQFPQTPPIFLNEALIDAFFKQREEREVEIKSASLTLRERTLDEGYRQFVMNQAFPQKFDACYPSFGKPCPFRKLCFGNVEDPLRAGYVVRQPHHKLEEDSLV